MAHRRAEIAFVVVAILLYSNALIGPLFAPDQTASDDLAWLRYLWLPAYAGTVGFCLLRVKSLARAWAGLLLLALSTGWVIASANWSLDPETTTRRGVALAATTLFGVYLAASFARGRFVPILGACFVALALGSVAMALGYPKARRPQRCERRRLAGTLVSEERAGRHDGLWRDHLPGQRHPHGPAAVVGRAALCLGLVLMSRSKTALSAPRPRRRCICWRAPCGGGRCGRWPRCS